MEKKVSIIETVKQHVKRVLSPNWCKCLKDFRSGGNCEWNFQYIMEVLIAGAFSGCKTLRDVETLSEIYGERVPDTTLHDIIIRVDPSGLAKELAKGVKDALRDHELPKDEFPIRLTAIDGKGTYTTDIPVGECSDPIGGGGNNEIYRHMNLRAFYVSSETKLYLGQRQIPSKGAETIELLPFIEDLQALYGNTNLLQVISIDAGMVSKENAQKLRDKHLHYIMALKGPQQRLSALALELFSSQLTPICRREEVYNGSDVTRELYRVQVSNIEGWKHLTEIWKIVTSIYNPKSGETESFTRLFLSSLPPSILSNYQVLEAVRMHWGIENNANWCFDVNWLEDTAPWASKAMVFVSYLKMMAFNIIQRLKTRKLKSYRALRWKDFFRYFEHALCSIRYYLETIGQATPAFL